MSSDTTTHVLSNAPYTDDGSYPDAKVLLFVPCHSLQSVERVKASTSPRVGDASAVLASPQHNAYSVIWRTGDRVLYAMVKGYSRDATYFECSQLVEVAPIEGSDPQVVRLIG